jgi:hypothetical protein
MADINSSAKRGAGGKFESARRGDKPAAGGNDGTPYVDPVAAGNAAGEPDEPSAAPKRGRPPGSGSGAKVSGKTASASLDLSTAIGVIQGFHAVIGGLARQPHWFVNDADARRYGQAMANAARHFPMRSTQKAIDVSMFLICAVSIEAPRIVLSMQIARQPRPPQRGPAQVFQFVSPQGSPNAPASPATSSASPPQQPDEGAGALADAPIDPSSFDGALGSDPAA